MSIETQHTHFADEWTLKRLAKLEKENAELRLLLDQKQRCECSDEDACAFVRERDALREDKARLLEAATLGLEYVREVLAQKRQSFAGYPDRHAQEEADEAMINAAIDAARKEQGA